MKIIVFSNSRQVEASNALPVVTVGVDSAMLRPGEPVFLSDDTSGFNSWIVAAVRIGRLGTHIPLSVADAYIDGHTLFHLLVPASADFRPNELWGLTDRTFSPGRWIEGNLPDAASALDVRKSSLRGIQTIKNIDSGIDITSSTARACVSAISNFATLKTGDVLIFADSLAEFKAECDTRLEASFNGDNVLDIKIK